MSRISICIALEYRHVNISTHIFWVPGFFLVGLPWRISKGPKTSIPHSRNGGVLQRRCEGSGAIFCDIVGARNILQWTQDSISGSILRRPPSARNPRCLIVAVVCFLPV